MYMYMDFIFTFFILPAIFQQSGKKKESASNFCDKFSMEISTTDSKLNTPK